MYEVNCPIPPELVNSISIMDENLYIQKEIYIIYLIPSGLWTLVHLGY